MVDILRQSSQWEGNVIEKFKSVFVIYFEFFGFSFIKIVSLYFCYNFVFLCSFMLFVE